MGEETGDPSVPTELLDLYVQLEDQGLTPEKFKEVFNVDIGDKKSVGSKETD